MSDIEWLGQPGHFVGAANCRWHLHTHVGGWCVSSVGEYFPRGAKEREPLDSGVCTEPGRMYYETMVFRLDGEGEISDLQGVLQERWPTRAEATREHRETVAAYALLARREPVWDGVWRVGMRDVDGDRIAAEAPSATIVIISREYPEERLVALKGAMGAPDMTDPQTRAAIRYANVTSSTGEAR